MLCVDMTKLSPKNGTIDYQALTCTVVVTIATFQSRFCAISPIMGID